MSNVQSYAVGALCGAGGWALLSVAFFALRHEWPASYSGIRNELEAHHRRGPTRFVLVRLAPVALVSMAAATAAASFGASAVTAALSTGIAHVASTDLRVVVQWRVLPRSRVAYHLMAAGAAMVAALIGWVLFRVFPDALPTGHEIRLALIVSATTALFGAAYLRATSSAGERDPYDNLDWVEGDVGIDLWDQIPSIAREHKTDPYLMRAIVAAEVSQRPRWLRRVERHWPGTRTFGVAQMSSKNPISDRESVEHLCQAFTGYTPPRDSGWLREGPLEARLEQHNSSPEFLNDVLGFLNRLAPTTQQTITVADAASDGLPVVTVDRSFRVGREVRLEGTAFHPSATFSIREPESNRELATGSFAATYRDEWSATVPQLVSGAEVRLEGSGEVPEVTVEISNLVYHARAVR